MNWNKALIIGVAGGIVLWLYNFVMHGMVMAETYMGNAVFRQDGNPAWFLAVEAGMAFGGALLFVKTRAAWADGPKGGIMFGSFMGLVAFFAMFTYPLVISAFPYYLAWCWGGIAVIGWMLYGAVAGLIHKQA